MSIQHVQKWLELTQNNYWSKVHDCTKISHEFMSEKCALRKGGFSKKPVSVYIKKPKKTKNNNKKKPQTKPPPLNKQPLGGDHEPVLILVATHVAELSDRPPGRGPGSLRVQEEPQPARRGRGRRGWFAGRARGVVPGLRVIRRGPLPRVLRTGAVPPCLVSGRGRRI